MSMKNHLLRDWCVFYFVLALHNSKVMDDYGVGRPSVFKTTKTLLKEDGWWGFYRGFGPRFLNMSLYGTTMIVTYELISKLASQSLLLNSCDTSLILAEEIRCRRLDGFHFEVRFKVMIVEVILF